MLDEQSVSGGIHGAGKARASKRGEKTSGLFGMDGGEGHRLGDIGGASRFFYCAKISSSERNAGLAGQVTTDGRAKSIDNPFLRGETERKNHHPTVKPQKLMRYFCKMITPPGGTVLDPFAGSGSTGIAAVLEGFEFIGIEREPEYVQIAEKRIYHALPVMQKQYDTEAP